MAVCTREVQGESSCRGCGRVGHQPCGDIEPLERLHIRRQSELQVARHGNAGGLGGTLGAWVVRIIERCACVAPGQ